MTSTAVRRYEQVPTRAALLAGAAIPLALSWMVSPLYAALGLGVLITIALTLRWPLVGFILIAFSVPWLSGFSLPVGSFPVTLTDVLVGSVGLAWLVSAAYVRTNPLATSLWAPWVALFLLAIIASVSQAADVKASAREIVKWVELLVVYLSAVWFIRSTRAVRWLLAALVAAGVSEAVLGFVQFGFNLGPQAFATGRLFLRAYGTFDQPNPYAGYLNMMLPFAVAMAALGRPGGERRIYSLAAVLIAGAVLVSESRGALLAGLVATAVVLALLAPRIRFGAWVLVLAGLSGAWLSSFGLVPVGPFQRALSVVGLAGVSFGHVTDANFSTVERAAHWLAGIRMFAAHPLLGVGIGNYAVAYPAYHPRGWYASLQHAHNYYINVAAEAGVVGLTAYVLLVGSALWYSYAALKRARNRLLQAAVLGVLGALVATSFHNLFDVLYVHGTVALLGLLMALVPVTLRCTEGEARRFQYDGT